MDQFLQNALPSWAQQINDPNFLLNWLQANQVAIGLAGGAFIFVYFGICLLIRRIVLRARKKAEFGADVWADHDLLRKQGRVRKDI
jgi:hypothetical protein